MRLQTNCRIGRAVAALVFLIGGVDGTACAAGGLWVQLGGDGAELSRRLPTDGRLLIHRLESDREQVEAARRLVQSQARYGQVSVEHWTGRTLPYADNLVNGIVVEESLEIPESELMRVLAPHGEAHIRQGAAYKTVRKPRPPEMGEWTHPWQGPGGNMAAEDTYLGVPNGVQWLAGPLFPLDARKSSAHGLVSAGGRVFYVTQNVLPNLDHVAERPPNYLVCRDGFNGLQLWSREWRGPIIDGTSNVAIVAVGERVYGVEDGKVIVLDAATGETVQRYATPDAPGKIVVSDGVLVAEGHTGLMGFDTGSGELLWHFPAEAPLGTVVDGGRLFSIVGTRERSGEWLHEILCVDLHRGTEHWRTPTKSRFALRNSSALRLHFAADGIVCLVDKNLLRALSSEDGSEVWSKQPEAEGRDGWDTRLVGHFFGQGLVWMRGNDAERKLDSQEVWHGLDPRTGQTQRSLETSGEWPETANPAKMGCQPLMATERFILFPRQATCVDFVTGEKETFKFARGGCVIGAIPANGLAYVSPHACGCYSEAIRGFLGLCSATLPDSAEALLERGPAYGDLPASPASASAEDWPTYRYDARRGASSPVTISGDLRRVWEARIGRPASDEWALRAGSPLTPPVIVGNRAYVAETEAHRLLALDTERGSVLWDFVAGGRITTPPTIWNGLCLFGSHDGWVYCLRADDGRLVWRFLAAPNHRRIVAYGQLESAWPTAGAVLIHDGLAYVAAGRAPDADGGIFVHALQPETGELVWSSQPGPEVNGMCDYLVSDGSHVYLSNWQFDPRTGEGRLVEQTEHLRGGKAGLLEASWTRIEMALRKAIQDWAVAETAGQLLAFTPRTTFGYAWTKDGNDRKLPGVLFAEGALDWSQTISGPSQVEAVVLTRDVLFAAGPQDRGDRDAGGAIWSHSAESGERLQSVELPAPPVYDGLAAAHGRLYVATSDGRILCYEGQ